MKKIMIILVDPVKLYHSLKDKNPIEKAILETNLIAVERLQQSSHFLQKISVVLGILFSKRSY